MLWPGQPQPLSGALHQQTILQWSTKVWPKFELHDVLVYYQRVSQEVPHPGEPMLDVREMNSNSDI